MSEKFEVGDIVATRWEGSGRQAPDIVVSRWEERAWAGFGGVPADHPITAIAIVLGPGRATTKLYLLWSITDASGYSYYDYTARLRPIDDPRITK